MKEKVVFKTGEFTDFKGETRKFTVAAVSRPLKEFSILYEPNLTSSVTKILEIGFAICNPEDEYDEEIGQKVAYSKAISNKNHLKMFVSFPGMINTKVVDALIDQEINYFKNNPASHIEGYNDAKRNWLNSKQKKEEIKNIHDQLAAADLETVNYLSNMDKEKLNMILKLVNEG